MQAKEIAELTGTTVRTIRHYHAIGLVPVPAVRYGRRDYDVSHVARVSRIRWLAESGLPLARIASVLAADPAAGGPDDRARVLADLRATLDVLAERIDVLADQRDRLVGLVATLERGESLSPLPPPVAAFYVVLEEGAQDEATRHGVRREREFLELAYLRGSVPPEADLLFAGIDEDVASASLEAFRSTLTGELTDEMVEEAAAGNVERMKDRFGDQLAEVARTVDPDALRGLYELFSATGDDRDRRLGEAVLRHLLLALEEARAK